MKLNGPGSSSFYGYAKLPDGIPIFRHSRFSCLSLCLVYMFGVVAASYSPYFAVWIHDLSSCLKHDKEATN
jgi:hypothetical protein